MARRSLGKGAAEDNLVLDTTVWQVLNAREMEEVMPLKVGEPKADFDMEKTCLPTFQEFPVS